MHQVRVRGEGLHGNGMVWEIRAIDTLDCLEQICVKLVMTMALVHCQVFIVISSHNQLYIIYVQKCGGRGSTKKNGEFIFIYKKGTSTHELLTMRSQIIKKNVEMFVGFIVTM